MAIQIAAADAEALLSMLIGYGMGAASSPAVGRLAGALGGGSLGGGNVGLARDILEKPAMEGAPAGEGFGSGGTSEVLRALNRAGVADNYPHPMHTVAVTGVEPGVHNTGIDYAVAKDASRMQSLEEHNKALTAFIRPGMNEAQLTDAITKGKELEQRLLPFWDDSKPRKTYHPTSSAVQAIRLTPDGRIQVMWRQKTSKSGAAPMPRWYTYRVHKDPHEASLVMSRLLTSGSLGRSVMPGKGWFGVSEYDSAQAVGHGARPRTEFKQGSGYGRYMPYKIRHPKKR